MKKELSVKPERAVVCRLKIQGDNWQEVAGVLEQLLFDIKTKGSVHNTANGGRGSGFILDVKENPSQTNAKYLEHNRAYLRQLKRAASQNL